MGLDLKTPTDLPHNNLLLPRRRPLYVLPFPFTLASFHHFQLRQFFLLSLRQPTPPHPPHFRTRSKSCLSPCVAVDASNLCVFAPAKWYME